MLFSVCQNSIGKYDFGSVALYAPPPGVLQVAKSPVLLGLNVAREEKRYKLSNRAVSCTCTALLVDLSIITEEDTRHIIGKSKIYRDREIIRKNEIKTGGKYIF